jgi:hypothetical protein
MGLEEVLAIAGTSFEDRDRRRELERSIDEAEPPHFSSSLPQSVSQPKYRRKYQDPVAGSAIDARCRAGTESSTK